MATAPAITIIQTLPTIGYDAWSEGFWKDTERATFTDDTKTIAGKVSDSKGVAILTEVDLVAFQTCEMFTCNLYRYR